MKNYFVIYDRLTHNDRSMSSIKLKPVTESNLQSGVSLLLSSWVDYSADDILEKIKKELITDRNQEIILKSIQLL